MTERETKEKINELTRRLNKLSFQEEKINKNPTCKKQRNRENSSRRKSLKGQGFTLVIRLRYVTQTRTRKIKGW